MDGPASGGRIMAHEDHSVLPGMRRAIPAAATRTHGARIGSEP